MDVGASRCCEIEHLPGVAKLSKAAECAKRILLRCLDAGAVLLYGEVYLILVCICIDGWYTLKVVSTFSSVDEFRRGCCGSFFQKGCLKLWEEA